MTQINHEERDIWISGQHDCAICTSAIIYPKSIVVTVEMEHVTVHQMKKALSREFPRHNFYLNNDGSGYIRADAERFVDDGL